MKRVVSRALPIEQELFSGW